MGLKTSLPRQLLHVARANKAREKEAREKAEIAERLPVSVTNRRISRIRLKSTRCFRRALAPEAAIARRAFFSS